MKFMNYLIHFICGASLCIPLAGSGKQGCVIARVHKGALTERAVNLFPNRQGLFPGLVPAAWGTLRKISAYARSLQEDSGCRCRGGRRYCSGRTLCGGWNRDMATPNSWAAPSPLYLILQEAVTQTVPWGTNCVWVQDREITGGCLAMLTVASVKRML